MTSSTLESRIESFKKRLQIPLLLILIVAIVCFMIPEVTNYFNCLAAEKWATSPAKMTGNNNVIVVVLKDLYFEPRVEYKYEINGKTYTGNRIGLNSLMLGYDMGVFSNSHEVGQNVVINVDPANPANSILEPHADLALLVSKFTAALILAALIYISTYPKVVTRTT